MLGQYPFDRVGTEVGADGIRRYEGLPRNVVSMLRTTVERNPDRTAVIELGGPSVTYAQLWERARRIAGGLRDAGVGAGGPGRACSWATASTGRSPSGARTSPAPSSSR